MSNPDAPAATAPAETGLLVATEGRLRILTLNRPERLNALTPELHHRLRDAVAAAAADPEIGAVVLTGAGRAFCSGGDVKRSADDAQQPARRESVEERADTLRAHGQTAQLLHGMGKPSVAILNGAAAGAGLALALACDLRFASREAVLRTAYGRLGLPGDLGISYFLERLAGPARARELLFLSEPVAADAALALGLVNRVFAPDALGEAFDLARRLAAGPTLAYRYMKQNLALAASGSLDEVIEREAYNVARCVRSEDVREATAAFRERREPQFRGR